MSLPNDSHAHAYTLTPSRTGHDRDVPLVFDSPHSGTLYPGDFDCVAPRAALRRAEDTHVDALYAAAPDHGATLIAAQFPRSYIDANRSLLDIDQALLDSAWPGPINASRKTEKGVGLVWRLLDTGEAIYSRKLSVAELQSRIARFYSPYHKAVRDAINAAHKHYGAVWHVNCHSMPATSSVISEEGPGVSRADFVLGDRDGSACAPDFTNFVAATLRGMGYDVRLNDPYKGVELVRAYSDPAAKKHSLQIEVNRKLYMDEESRERNTGFAELQANLTRLIAAIADFARANVPAHAHHHDCDHDHAPGHEQAHPHGHAHGHAHDDHAQDHGHHDHSGHSHDEHKHHEH